ncbi:MAG: SIS domain-containing protein [Alphaproteobacteria bacterium]
MTSFPERPYDTIGAYCNDYLEQLARAGASIDHNNLAAAADLLGQTFERGAWLFVCGNGGSAAIANHLLCDFAKGIQTDTDLLPRVISLSANLEMITAIANDIAFEDCFVYQLRTAARPGDILLTISSSGDSENVVRAVDWASVNNVQTISLTGFEGGRTARGANINIHVKGDNYGVVEDTHQSIMHVFSQYLRQSRMTKARIVERKF